jgi:MoaA/NifB/PqqE/SkfB family radical SAM enzyme
MIPTQIRLEASSFCQLRCPSCPTTAGAIHPAIGSGFLRFDDFKALIDQNPSVTRVELANYGEALLNPHLLTILEYANSKAIEITFGVGVNFNHAKDELLEGLVKYRVRHIVCSIDGASSETYRMYRIRGDFEKVIAHIKRLNYFKSKHQSELPELTWQFIVFGHNEHEIPVAREMAKQLGMRFRTKISWDAKFSPIRDKDFVRMQTGELALTREEYEQIHGNQYLSEICRQLFDDPQINWDGKNLGCCRNFWGDFGGNVFTDGLRACFNHEKMSYARAMLRGRVPARDDIPCSTCEMYHSMRARSNWIQEDEAEVQQDRNDRGQCHPSRADRQPIRTRLRQIVSQVRRLKWGSYANSLTMPRRR